MLASAKGAAEGKVGGEGGGAWSSRRCALVYDILGRGLLPGNCQNQYTSEPVNLHCFLHA